jgi:hypothetical protein
MKTNVGTKKVLLSNVLSVQDQIVAGRLLTALLQNDTIGKA